MSDGLRRAPSRWPSAQGLAQCLAAAGLWAAASVAAEPAAGDPTRGRLLYEAGVDAAGMPLRAQRLGVGDLSAGAAACVNCHRPSTMGGIEGGLLVPPIGGQVLFAPGQAPSTRMAMRWMRHQTRSAYDSRSLRRALQEGVDPDGQRLGAEMPRYTLSAVQAADLEAYLRQRGQEPVPGLQGGVLRLATVTTPDAPAARRDAVLKVMQAWSQGLGFGRVSVQWRAWSLSGAADTWPEQLARLNQAFPVFGLVSGAGGAQWTPVQQFCEQQRLACVLPSVDRLPGGAPPRHTVYFSPAVEGEALMLAQALSQQTGDASKLQQLWRGEAGAAGAAALREAMRRQGRNAPAAEWTTTSAVAGQAPAEALVLWMAADDAGAWLARHAPGPHSRVYLSAQLAPPQQLKLPQHWRPRVQWVSMRAAPADLRGALALSLEPWAQAAARQGLGSLVDFAEARAAAFLFADAAGLSQGVLQPDYLIERLETAVATRLASRVYVQASLGPQQRLASKGGYLLGFQNGSADALVRTSGYLRAVP